MVHAMHQTDIQGAVNGRMGHEMHRRANVAALVGSNGHGMHVVPGAHTPAPQVADGAA